jgi:predicted phage terminase large subunit-like protein
MLMFGLRLGNDPRAVVTTTPRPTKLIKALIADPKVVVTRGSTAENRKNLAPAFLDQIVRRYEGTRLGRQELEAEILEDVPGALWSHAIIDATRVAIAPQLTRIVVAIDPAAGSGEHSDETGIVVAGKNTDGHGYVLADLSGRYTPTEWARAAIAAYRAHSADRIVAEINNGGEMVEATIRIVDPTVSFAAVHASRGKVARAEPVAALYEQGRVHHLGALPRLEDQMCGFAHDFDRAVAGYSPDRVDALVWALTELLVEPIAGEGIFEAYRRLAHKENEAP